MTDLLPAQLPWWVAGPGIGLCVVALYALAGVKLGVSGGWLQVVNVLASLPGFRDGAARLLNHRAEDQRLGGRGKNIGTRAAYSSHPRR